MNRFVYVQRLADKTPLNLLANNVKQQPLPFTNFDDLDSIVSNLKTNLKCGNESNKSKQYDDDEMIEMTPDDNLLTSESLGEIGIKSGKVLKDIEVVMEQHLKLESDYVERPLSNFTIEIDSITPSDSPPRIIMEEPTGLKIVLHFAKDRPRDDISVIVITTTNHNSIPIKDYQFDASVSKVSV